MEVYLAIDSSTPNLVLGLYSPQQGLLGVYENRLERNIAKYIIPEIDNLLKQANIVKTKLSGITVGLGPGSYTGIKIALATAKGLARGLNIPLQGVSTLAAIAYAQLVNNEISIIALDARRDNLYAAVYKKEQNKIILLEAEQKIAIQKLQEKYPNYKIIKDAIPSAEYLASFIQVDNSALKPIYL